MQNINNVLNRGESIIFESGTGSGKTICTLSSVLEYCLKNDKRIIYTTRTNAQQRQVIIELREIKKKLNKDEKKFFGVGMQGRANMCLLARNDPDLACGTSEELAKFCSNEKKKTRSIQKSKNKGCIYYKHYLEAKEEVDDIIKWFKSKLPTTEEFIKKCDKIKICPYEMNKLLIRDASLVVVPYVYVFDSVIRNMLLDWFSIPEEDIILVIDEAHNLPDYIRDLYSSQLSLWMLKNCVSEIEKYGDPSLANGSFSVSFFCKTLIDILTDIKDTYIYAVLEDGDGIRREPFEKNDAFIPSHEFESEILSRMKITSKTLSEIIGDLIAFGEKIQEYLQKKNKLPRSYLHKLGVFLEFWINLELDQYVKLIVDTSKGKNPRIEAYCLDPSMGTGIINRFHSSVHMSGTLEPLEQYRDSLGFSEDTELVTYPSPFPLDNRRIYYVRDVTTKYSEIAKDKVIFSRMKKHISSICNTFPRNTMIFFPSFNILSAFKSKENIDDIQRNLYVEEQEMSQTALMDLVTDFKECGLREGESAALFSVMGGRISEGMDFPAEQLEIAIIVGIPYPKPTARQQGLQRYYDLKFRKGWEYTVEAPTARKLLQSIGRLIRNENDRGVAVILDRRASRFKKYIKDLNESKNLKEDIELFMDKQSII